MAVETEVVLDSKEVQEQKEKAEEVRRKEKERNMEKYLKEKYELQHPKLPSIEEYVDEGNQTELKEIIVNEIIALKKKVLRLTNAIGEVQKETERFSEEITEGINSLRDQLKSKLTREEVLSLINDLAKADKGVQKK